ncbi:MAG TPA: hypothetical protein VGB76_14400 [Pyrinomonadaceae bacterium]
MLINGRNFLLDFDGQARRVGFYATRTVEAATADEAESAAVELLRSDELLRQSTLNEQTDPPMMYVEEIVEVRRRKKGEDANTGFSFYNESE